MGSSNRAKARAFSCVVTCSCSGGALLEGDAMVAAATTGREESRSATAAQGSVVKAGRRLPTQA